MYLLLFFRLLGLCQHSPLTYQLWACINNTKRTLPLHSVHLEIASRHFNVQLHTENNRFIPIVLNRMQGVVQTHMRYQIDRNVKHCTRRHVSIKKKYRCCRLSFQRKNWKMILKQLCVLKILCVQGVSKLM